MKSGLSQFFRGYVTAALWSSNDESDEPLDRNYSDDDLAPSAARSMRRDCAKFIKQNKRDLLSYAEKREHVRHRGEGSAWDHAGHDFWLSRNGHGTGFWDRGLGALGDRLADAAKKFRESDLYVGDDGKIYVSP